MKKILLIAGLDPSGNAGLLRDLEMVHSFPLQSPSALKASAVATALTAQNEEKFLALQPVSPRTFELQLRSIAPLSKYQAIKIGMLGNEKLVQILVRFLKKEKKLPPIVLDPVLASSTGGTLLAKKGRDVLWNELIPLVNLWTPNIDEARYFGGKIPPNPPLPKGGRGDLEKMADFLWSQKKVSVLIKGGHLTHSTRFARSGRGGEKVEDLFFDGTSKTWFVFHRMVKKKIRGTGCALSTLIACFLAEGFPLPQAIRQGRITMQNWIQGA